MREKRSNIVSLRLTDTDLVSLDSLVHKLQQQQAVPVIRRRSEVAYGLLVQALVAADKSKSFPSHFPPAEGKILRVKRSQLRARASKVA